MGASNLDIIVIKGANPLGARDETELDEIAVHLAKQICNLAAAATPQAL